MYVQTFQWRPIDTPEAGTVAATSGRKFAHGRQRRWSNGPENKCNNSVHHTKITTIQFRIKYTDFRSYFELQYFIVMGMRPMGKNYIICIKREIKR